VRKDAFAEQNRVVPEVEKDPMDRGLYLHPDAFGLPKDRGINFTRERKQREEKERAQIEGGSSTDVQPPR
jgi:hypothetical protein